MANQVDKDIGTFLEREQLEGTDHKCTSTMRSPPPGDHQADFFIPQLYDVGTRDSRNVMDVAVCRLSKRNNRGSATITSLNSQMVVYWSESDPAVSVLLSPCKCRFSYKSANLPFSLWKNLQI
ncbi:hypothetical protein CFI10_12985 [Marinobacterium iners]|nr:hypothetical protein CFI10_12985 [Marinobacterium iners]